jgi:hypothetical protein
MVDQWYYAGEGGQQGPFSAVQLKECALLGRIQPTDMIWREGMARGVLAARVKNLFPAEAGQALAGQANEPTANEPAPAAHAINREGALPQSKPADTDPAVIFSPAPTPTSEAAPAGKPRGKGRAMAVKGAVIISQNGESVQYRKKCERCGHAEACRTSMLIRRGCHTAIYFCPKCKKTSQVMIQGFTE